MFSENLSYEDNAVTLSQAGGRALVSIIACRDLWDTQLTQLFDACITPNYYYVLYNLSTSERSAMAQFRFGILPLNIETSRF